MIKRCSTIKHPIVNTLPGATLQYADDTLIICQAEASQLRALKAILNSFAQATGLKINFTKSTMVTLHTSPEHSQELAGILQCKLETFPQTYLGLPLSATKLPLAAFQPLIAKVDKYLAGWQAPLLNYAGRTILVNSVLGSLPTYAMAALLIPKGTLEAMDKRRRAFLWTGEESCHGSKCLIAWDLICRSKRHGGLGIKHLQTQNICLLVKMLFRLYSQSSPWTSWIWREHADSHLGSVDLGPHWRSMIDLLPLLRSQTTIKVGDGRHTNFWHDIWMDDQPLATRFHALYTHAIKQSCSLNDICQRGLSHSLVPRLSTEAQSQLNILEALLQQLPLALSQDEIVSKIKCKNGIISSSALYHLQMSNFQTWTQWEYIWESKAPPRIKFFGWLLAFNRLPSRVNLHKKKILPTPTCEICSSAPEDADHIFLHCPLASAFWTLIKITPSISTLSMLQSNSLVGAPIHMNNTLFLLCCRRLWNHRNEVVFKNQPPSISRLLKCCSQDAKLWAHRFKQADRSILPAWLSIFSSPLSLL